jgi:hypothetical protein
VTDQHGDDLPRVLDQPYERCTSWMLHVAQPTAAEGEPVGGTLVQVIEHLLVQVRACDDRRGTRSKREVAAELGIPHRMVRPLANAQRLLQALATAVSAALGNCNLAAACEARLAELDSRGSAPCGGPRHRGFTPWRMITTGRPHVQGDDPVRGPSSNWTVAPNRGE